MGNREKFKRAWLKHREAVQGIYRAWQEDVAKLEGYKGSKLGDEKLKEAQTRYNNDLAAARQRFSSEIDPVMHDMRAKMEQADRVVTPPTEEQLRILQTVQLMPEGSMDAGDYIEYLELCKGSSMACKTLWNLAKTRVGGGVSLKKPSAGGESLGRNYQAMLEAAKALWRWDGSSREAAVNGFIGEARAGVPIEARKSDMSAPAAGEIDPTSAEFEKAVVGIWYDPEAVKLLD